MAGSITGIDHVIVGVHDLEAARAAYARLGFTLTPRGSHIGWGTANYCIMFADDYVEILGVVDAATVPEQLHAFLEAREGLQGVAFAAADAGQAFDELAARGIPAEEPRDLARRLELPEGTVLPEFKLVFLGPEATPGLSAFICQHLTPGLIRRPEWLAHANGARAIVSLTAVVEDAVALIPAYERLFGSGAVTRTDEMLAVHAGRTRLLFAAPEDLSLLHPAAEPLPGIDPPYLAAMGLEVDDPNIAANHLGRQGIAFHREADGAVHVEPGEASGVWLEFARRR